MKNMTFLVKNKLIVLLMLLSLSSFALAGNVSCAIMQIDTLEFGDYNPLSGVSDEATSQTHVNCQADWSDTVHISINCPDDSTCNTRFLKNSLADQKLRYQLYQDANHTRIWGSEESGHALEHDTGVGINNFYDKIYAVIPPGQMVARNSYSGTLTFMVTF